VILNVLAFQTMPYILREIFQQWRSVGEQRLARLDLQARRFDVVRLKLVCRAWWRLAQDSSHVAAVAAARQGFAPAWHALPAAAGLWPQQSAAAAAAAAWQSAGPWPQQQQPWPLWPQQWSWDQWQQQWQ
jgi:hypothetical protein